MHGRGVAAPWDSVAEARPHPLCGPLTNPQLIMPYLDLDIKYFDLGMPSRCVACKMHHADVTHNCVPSVVSPQVCRPATGSASGSYPEHRVMNLVPPSMCAVTGRGTVLLVSSSASSTLRAFASASCAALYGMCACR